MGRWPGKQGTGKLSGGIAKGVLFVEIFTFIV